MLAAYKPVLEASTGQGPYPEAARPAGVDGGSAVGNPARSSERPSHHCLCLHASLPSVAVCFDPCHGGTGGASMPASVSTMRAAGAAGSAEAA